jgi:TLC domain.
MTFHHFAGIIVFGYSIYLQNSGSECVYAILLAEISNPFNLSREILKHFKEENTNKFHYVSLTFAVLFIITRYYYLSFLNSGKIYHDSNLLSPTLSWKSSYCY